MVPTSLTRPTRPWSESTTWPVLTPSSDPIPSTIEWRTPLGSRAMTGAGTLSKGTFALQRQEPLRLLAGDGLLAQPDVVEREPVVLGLEARVVVAELIDLGDRGRKAVTGGADAGEHLLHRDQELRQERRRAADDVGVTEPQKQRR